MANAMRVDVDHAVAGAVAGAVAAGLETRPEGAMKEKARVLAVDLYGFDPGTWYRRLGRALLDILLPDDDTYPWIDGYA